MEKVRVVELHVVTQDERVSFAVLGNGPAFGDGRHHLQILVHIHQPVVKLVTRPYRRLPGRKRRIQTQDAGRFVIVEDLLVGMVELRFAGDQQNSDY